MRISVIMQSYLGDYPGSRLNPVEKFIRAVNTFINQQHKDSELIIVSDGCELTHRSYHENFKSNDRIKYLYIDKKEANNMYDLVNGEKFYRGIPRQIARSLATGEITTYMDSDDYILSNHLSVIDQIFSSEKKWDWAVNCTWYDSYLSLNDPIDKTNTIYLNSNSFGNETYGIAGLDGHWIAVKMQKDSLPLMPWLFSHKSDIDTKWRDCVGTVSEDIDFSKRLRSKYENGGKYALPTYARCHYTGKWDF